MQHTPSALQAIARKQRNTLIAIYCGIICIGLLSVYYLDRVSTRLSLESQKNAIASVVNGLEVRGAARLRGYVNMTQNMAGLMDHGEAQLPSQFNAIAGVLSDERNSIRSIVLTEDLIITQVYPLEENRGALGFDLSQREDLREQINYTVNTGEVSITGPVKLIRGDLGVILRAVASDPRYLYSVVLDVESFLESIGATGANTDLQNRIGIRAVVTGPDISDAIPRVIAGDAVVWEGDPVIGEIQLGATALEIGMIPAQGWITTSPHRLTIVLVLSAISVIGIFGVHYARHLIQDRAKARRQLISAIESLEDGFAIYDENDRLLLCNEKYRTIYNESPEILTPGTKFEKIIREGVARGQIAQAIGREEEWVAERLRDHANPKGPVEQQMTDGRWLKVAESKTPEGYTVGFRVDVTELKRAIQKAEEANVAKTDFLNNMSHELRTPLSVVMGSIAFLKNVTILPRYRELAAAIGDDEEAREKLEALAADIVAQAERTDRSGQHLMGLINSVLDWATISVGEVELKLDEVQLDDMIEKLCEDLRSKAEEKALTLTCSVAERAIEGDALRLRQVFINLITNALKFTETGGVHVDMADHAEGIAISVIDTGPGVPLDLCDTIFERFAQVDGSSKRKFGGAGLGLAISRSLVELHGGRIELDSAPGEGSRFTVILPDHVPEISPKDSASAMPEVVGAGLGDRKDAKAPLLQTV